MSLNLSLNRNFLLLTIYDLCLSDKFFDEEHFSSFWIEHVRNMRDVQTRLSWRKWSLISTLLMELYSYSSRVHVSRLQVSDGMLSLRNGGGHLSIIALLNENDIVVSSSYEKVEVRTTTRYGWKLSRDLFKLDLKVETINLEDLNGFFERNTDLDSWLILNLESKIDNLPRSADDLINMTKYLQFEQRWCFADMEMLLVKHNAIPQRSSSSTNRKRGSSIKTVHDQMLEKSKTDSDSGFITSTSVFRSFFDLFSSKTV